MVYEGYEQITVSDNDSYISYNYTLFNNYDQYLW